jgi:hypothetical protein
MKNHLKECGNLAEQMLDTTTPIFLYRVFGYESITQSRIFSVDRDRVVKTDLPFVVVILQIEKVMKELGWYENKSVADVTIGSHRVFIGFYDNNINIGLSLIPNYYPPYLRKNMFDSLEKIQVR